MVNKNHSSRMRTSRLLTGPGRRLPPDPDEDPLPDPDGDRLDPDRGPPPSTFQDLDGDPLDPPPVDRQTPVKTLPYPNLRLRAVNIDFPQVTLN